MTEMLDYLRDIEIPKEYFYVHKVDGFSDETNEIEYLELYDIMKNYIQTQNLEKKHYTELIEQKSYLIFAGKDENDLFPLMKIQRFYGNTKKYNSDQLLKFVFGSKQNLENGDINYIKDYGNKFKIINEKDYSHVEFYELHELPELNPIK